MEAVISRSKLEETLVSNIKQAKEYFAACPSYNSLPSYKEIKFEKEYKDCLVKKSLMVPSKFESFF